MIDYKIAQEELLVELDGLEKPIDWARLYGNAHPVEMEIGVGKGRFIRELAARRPETNFLAIERARKYARICLHRAARDGQANLRVFIGDAPELLQDYVPDASLAALYILYSDPWPKRRHKKRRLFQPETVALFERKLTADARLEIKTDVDALFEEIESLIRAHTDLTIIESGPVDPQRFDPALRTNYEVKTVKRGAKVNYLHAQKT